MATFVPVPGVKLLLKGTDQGRKFSYALWAIKAVPATPTSSELEAIAIAVGTAIAGNAFLGNTSPSIVYTNVEARDATVLRGPNFETTFFAAGTAADGLPSAMSAKVVVFPAATTFQFRPGQTFLPGLPTSALTEPGSDTLTGAYITAAETFITDLATAIATVSTYQLGCVSKNLSGHPRAEALVSQSSGQAVRPTIATQVRRLRRVSRPGA